VYWTQWLAHCWEDNSWLSRMWIFSQSAGRMWDIC